MCTYISGGGLRGLEFGDAVGQDFALGIVTSGKQIAHLCTYIHIYTHIYIHIYRERDAREGEVSDMQL
jgi:hypothetical protein